MALGHADTDGFEGFEILLLFLSLELYLLAREVLDCIVDHLELIERGFRDGSYPVAPENHQRPEFRNIFGAGG